MQHWHTLSPEACLEALESQLEGLSAEAVATRQTRYGPNVLREERLKSPLLILWEQLSSIMVVILLVAAGLSAVLGDYKDAGVILAIVVFFVSLGVLQEYRAEKAIAALKNLSVLEVRVRRQGQSRLLPAPELVPGDMVLLEAGDQVPADLRLLEAHALKAQEAALTGESEAVEKNIDTLQDEHAPLGDRLNMLFMGTALSYGRAVGLVVNTGMETELGHIANLIQNVTPRQTPLQRRLDQVAKKLAVLAIVCSALIFIVGILRQEELKLMLMSAISVAVAAVPEGLPAVLTITLAFGAQRMLKRHALVRKLTGIETLGSVSVICSDKTGTLTQNKMTVTALWTPAGEQDLSGPELPDLAPASALLLLCGLLCNDSEAQAEQELGDPTELALMHVAQRFDWPLESIQAALPRLQERPFDSERKRMATLHTPASDLSQLPPALTQALEALPDADSMKQLVFVKGSLDSLLEVASQVWHAGRWQALDSTQREALEAANQKYASAGQRVLGFALRQLREVPDPHAELEAELGLLGLMAMIDPPRPEVIAALQTCRSAGIRTIMITGDHPLTAQKIALDLGLSEQTRVLTGRELQPLSQAQLQQELQTCSVFARVSPEHKLRIVHALQAEQQVVAMTGDGVNDAPALKQADIGVAMGITGTDVAKEAADMVLQDDNFATIVAAVEEGRMIYDNLRKFIKFSVAGNLGKILAMLIAPIFGMPLALLPIQMLWLNLMTDGLLGLGLGLEQAEKNIMLRQPTSPDESILGGKILAQIAWMGLLIAGVSMALTAAYWYTQGPDSPWQTVLFTSLACAQIFQALGIRSSRDSLLSLGFFSNRALAGMVVSVVILQGLVLYVPWLAALFRVQPLAPLDLLWILGGNLLILLITEGVKASGRSV